MKKASGVLYIICGIFAAIGAVVMLIVGITGLANAGIRPAEITPEAWQAACVAYLIGAGLLALSAVIGFAGFGLSRKESSNKGFHIFALVIGILSLDILLLLASIFALASSDNQ